MKRIFTSFGIILLFVSWIYISFILYSEVEEQTISNQYKQQEIYLNQAVLSIENFFDNFMHSLNYLSKKEDIIAFNEKSELLIKGYYEAHIEELKGITRISADGKIMYSYPYVESIIGQDVSAQAHNAYIIKNKRPVISDVFVTVQGYRAIVYAYPIFDNSEYKGCISLIIPFDYITNKFLKDIRIGKSGTSFVLSEKGYELFCAFEDHIGTLVYGNISEFNELNETVDEMLNKQEGKSEYLYHRNEFDPDVVKKIVVYKPINLENTFWSISVIMDEDEILEVNRGFVLKFVILLFIMAIITALFLYLYARERRKSRDKLNEKELKYKTDLEKLVEIRTQELKELNSSLQNDIVERKKIEQELKNAVERVEKSEKIKSDFLAQMSHEIRTPINTILSFSSLIKDELSQHADEELSYGFSGIQSAGNRLIRTIDLILNMSDIQLGIHEYIPKEIDICNDIIENLIIEYKIQLSEKKLDINYFNKTTDTKIIADSYTVNQIFANLLHNAIKYTLKGSITIECNRNSKNEFMVSIIDTGVGISEEYFPKLFEEFTQEDEGYTRKFEGNGLGLALVKKYCDLNNAEIIVESKKGEGSKFTVIFKKTYGLNNNFVSIVK